MLMSHHIVRHLASSSHSYDHLHFKNCGTLSRDQLNGEERMVGGGKGGGLDSAPSHAASLPDEVDLVGPHARGINGVWPCG